MTNSPGMPWNGTNFFSHEVPGSVLSRTSGNDVASPRVTRREGILPTPYDKRSRHTRIVKKARSLTWHEAMDTVGVR